MKKPSVVSFLITLLLAAAVSTHGSEYVTDISGNPVYINHLYFIEPVETENNNRGGLYPSVPDSQNPICGITQSDISFLPGEPVSFSLPLGVTAVKTSSSVSIEFHTDIPPVCHSKFWKIDDSSSATEEPAITIGGAYGERNSQFKIEAATGENTYKLTSFYRAGTVGSISEDGKLVLTNDTSKTLLVKLVKGSHVTKATTSTSRVEKLGLRMFPFY